MPSLAMDDPDFGRIQFDAIGESEFGMWQMDDDWEIPEAWAKVACCSIPGDKSGPYPEARSFLISKRHSLNDVWRIVELHLEAMRAKWRPDTGSTPLTEVFYLSALSMDHPFTSPPTWEVSFEPRDGFWIFASFQFQGDTFIDSSCDT